MTALHDSCSYSINSKLNYFPGAVITSIKEIDIFRISRKTGNSALRAFRKAGFPGILENLDFWSFQKFRKSGFSEFPEIPEVRIFRIFRKSGNPDFRIFRELT